MRGNPEVLTLLGELLTNELTAVNQYTLHAAKCADWGYQLLDAKLREQAADEATHRDQLIERILFLEGTPDLQRYHTIETGNTVAELLALDLKLEYAAIASLEAAVVKARDCRDNATEDLLVKILVSEQLDTRWLEAQLRLIGQVGEANYLAQQMFGG